MNDMRADKEKPFVFLCSSNIVYIEKGISPSGGIPFVVVNVEDCSKLLAASYGAQEYRYIGK